MTKFYGIEDWAGLVNGLPFSLLCGNPKEKFFWKKVKNCYILSDISFVNDDKWRQTDENYI